MRTKVDSKTGETTITLEKTEAAVLKRAEAICRELRRYPEKYPRAAAAADNLENIDTPVAPAK